MAQKTLKLLDNDSLIYINYDDSTGDYTPGGDASDPRDDIVAQYPVTVNMTKEQYAGSNTNISTEEVYNQLILTCELEDLDDLVDDPLKDDNMIPMFNGTKEKWATEYVAFGEGTTAYDEWARQLRGEGSTWEGSESYDHYVQLFRSSKWWLNSDDYVLALRNPGAVFQTFYNMPSMAFLAAVGKSNAVDQKDNTLKNKIDMKKCLCITVNGNEDNTESGARPTEAQLKANSPVAEFISTDAGGYLSPVDADTTNYIIISGKMFLQPRAQKGSASMLTGRRDWKYAVDHYNDRWAILRDYWHQTIHLDDSKNGDGAYYTCKWYDNGVVRTTSQENFYPLSAWKMGMCKYEYSQNGEQNDKIFMHPVIQMTIQVGDKYACQKWNSDGSCSYYWRTLEECPTTTYQGQTRPANFIWVGPNPAIDDYIIGGDWQDIANQVSPEMHLEDYEGIAIPIKKSDNLNGKVTITIDGPVNTSWNQIYRYSHGWWFWEHTCWGTDYYHVLANTAMIYINDFKVEIASDGAGILINDDKDLVYMTDDLGSTYTEKKDDIEFDLCTALTSEECKNKGVKQTVKKNSPYIGKEALRSVKNVVTGFEGKPEELYLKDYWNEYKDKKLLVETEIYQKPERSWTTCYTFPTLAGKVFHTQSESYNLKSGHITVVCKEI